MFMTKRKDATKLNECEESELIMIRQPDDPDDFESIKVCPQTRKNALEKLPKMLETFDILSDSEKTENILVGLTPKERERLYNHKLYDLNQSLKDLLP